MTSVQTYGMIKSSYNGDPASSRRLEWDGNYDGKMLNADIHVERDGYTKNIEMNIEPNQSIRILTEDGYSSENLEKRLKRELLMYPKNNFGSESKVGNRNVKIVSIKKRNTKKRTKRSKTRKNRVKINTQRAK